MSSKDILASTIVSVILVSAVGYAALPVLFPSLQSTSQNNSSTPSTDVDTDLGKVIQFKHIETSSLASINDDQNSAYIQVPNTTLSITVSANSVLDIVFTTPFLFGVGPGANNERFSFNVSVVLVGIGNQTISLSSFNSGSTSSYYEYSSTMYIHYISSKLSAGTYTISVFYISNFKDVANLAYLTMSYGVFNQTRSLSAMELR